MKRTNYSLVKLRFTANMDNVEEQTYKVAGSAKMIEALQAEILGVVAKEAPQVTYTNGTMRVIGAEFMIKLSPNIIGSQPIDIRNALFCILDLQRMETECRQNPNNVFVGRHGTNHMDCFYRCTNKDGGIVYLN